MAGIPPSSPLDPPVQEWVGEATQRLIDLIADLTDEQLAVPLGPTVNPILWEVGHITWFQEALVLRRTLDEPPLIAEADALWDSAAIPHNTRWLLNLPIRREILRYAREVADRVTDRLTGEEATGQLRYIAQYAVHHHDMHTEALTYTRQTLGYPAPTLPGVADPAELPAPPGPGGPLPGDAQVPGGRVFIGADRDGSFCHDNEKWLHPVQLADFAIARAPVTQEEFAAFVDDEGYRRRDLWRADGWAWRVEADAQHPVYWRYDGGWQRRDFDRWVPLEPHRPVSHVCWYEADAYCRWSGRRLPTEAEWEAAAVGPLPDGIPTRRRRFPWGDTNPAPHQVNMDWRHLGTVDVGAYPAGDSPYGCRQMIGNLWEWTDTTFGPYPNFEQDAYRDNSVTSFGICKVLRGGAWASRSRFIRSSARNYFSPDRRDVLAGFRTTAR